MRHQPFTPGALRTLESNNIKKETIINIIKNNYDIPKDFSPTQKQFENDEYSILMNNDLSLILSIIVKPKTLRSTISQPNLTHDIKWETEGCALQRTDVPRNQWNPVDCARCAISYVGIGRAYGRSILQNMAVDRFGIRDSEMNKWLLEHARRPDSISNSKWKDEVAPRTYFIAPQFKKKFGNIYDSTVIAIAAEALANKLLSRGEIVMSSWTLHGSFGHYFNIAKTDKSDIVWYVDAQENISPGRIKLLDRLLRLSRDDKKLSNIGFILTPWQASQLRDEDGTYMVFDPFKGLPGRGKQFKTKRKKKKSKQSKRRQSAKKRKSAKKKKLAKKTISKKARK